MSDSVCKRGDKWYFQNEVGGETLHGPFDTELIATEELRKYYVSLDLRV